MKEVFLRGIKMQKDFEHRWEGNNIFELDFPKNLKKTSSYTWSKICRV